MHWVIDSHDIASTTVVRQDIVSYLRRHAEPEASLDDAELVLSELISNGARHAAGPLWIAIDWSARDPLLRVADLGPGFDVDIHLPPEDTDGGRGLYIVSRLARELEVTRRRAGGTVLSVRLPVSRREQVSIDPPRRRTGSLPRLDEALPEGAFGKEPFLRALVVQLAQSVGELNGPDAAEAAVAQVGADVGGQMEEEFRRARSVVGRLDAQQMADCYVRLKHAIDGGFSVAEISDTQIVLENTRCPFGDAVRAAPSLCRMTSSVFGGIAARNSDHGATVFLEERIAVGDPGCRVIVTLLPAPAPGVDAVHVDPPRAHRYRTPV